MNNPLPELQRLIKIEENRQRRMKELDRQCQLSGTYMCEFGYKLFELRRLDESENKNSQPSSEAQK